MKIPESSVASVKQSYFNILALFLEGEKTETRFVTCLLKWGLQLHLELADIDAPGRRLEQLKFVKPPDKVSRLEAIYHLVQMIYIDDAVEDVELEISSIYAEKLGFKREIVGDLFRSIATKEADGASTQDMEKEIADFLKVQ